MSIIVWKHPGIHHRVIAREGGTPQHRVRRCRGFGAEIANLYIDHHHANVLVGEQHSRTCREVRLDVQRIPFRKRRWRHHGAIDDAGRERGDLLIPSLAFHRGLPLGFGLGIPVLLQVGACLQVVFHSPVQVIQHDGLAKRNFHNLLGLPMGSVARGHPRRRLLG